MRCFVGFVLFVAMYFSSCIFLGGVVRTISIAHGNSPSVARGMEEEAKRKWHALVAVGTGVATIFICCLPSILKKRCKQESWGEDVCELRTATSTRDIEQDATGRWRRREGGA